MWLVVAAVALAWWRPVAAACEERLQPALRHAPAPPQDATMYEELVTETARSFAELVSRRAADEASAGAAARRALAAGARGAALGAPQLNLGVLVREGGAGAVVFRRNNTPPLERYWRALAASWNASVPVWSGAWRACSPQGARWTRAVAAAAGSGAARAAAAVYLPLELDACDPALHEIMGSPYCEEDTTVCVRANDSTSRPTWAADDAEAVAEEAYGALYTCACLEGGRGVLVRDQRAACAPCFECRARVALLALNLASMALVVVVALLVFNKRKSKTIAVGMWTMLEMILLGAFLMYASSAVRYAARTETRCLLEAWLRELGFVSCYGAAVLKLYRHLGEFRTRKAHRSVLRDAELLRALAAMQAGAVCYLAAFSAAYSAAGGACGDACAARPWHHVTAAAELLLLALGAWLAHAARNAAVPFQEREFLCAALCLEAACSAWWRALAARRPELAPELNDASAAARAQLSASGALALVLGPKLWHSWRAGRSLAQEVSRRGPAEGFACEPEDGGGEASAEELRAELKRLYAQLEVLRNKTLRADNPHISKRRGGRKVAHRRFSLQALQARRGARSARAGGCGAEPEGTEVSRTPEDSVCSAEGPSAYTDGEAA